MTACCDRRVLNGIFWCRDLVRLSATCPSAIAHALLATTGFVRWRKARVWGRPMESITAAHDAEIQMIDSIFVASTAGCDGKKGVSSPESTLGY